MIIGIGTDIIEIDRIKKVIEKTDRFVERNFTSNEMRMFERKRFNPETIAGNFSAKEAVSKAIGTGIRGFGLKDIEILRDDLGKPIVRLSSKLLELLEKESVNIHVSISHDKTKAIAFAIWEE